jgi:uncharacterized protein DUF6760
MDQLPGGYWDSGGRLHRSFELSALTGREEELLLTAGAETASLVTAVLSRCLVRLGDLSPVPSAVVRSLLVGDRQYLLLRLRQLTFGDAVRANLLCPWPECGGRVSATFSLSSVPVVAPPERAPTFTVPVRDAEVTFRLPTGADQEELSALAATNEAEALTRLLARCVVGSSVEDLSSAARAELEDHMSRLAPRVEQTMELACVECGRTFLAPFDIHRFLLGELRTDRELLYQEVHYLAFHYHWSESEIMAMPREKRRTYIEVLGDAIEVLNGAG